MLGLELFHIYLGFLVFGVGYAFVGNFLGALTGDGDGSDGGGDFDHDAGVGDHGGHDGGGDVLSPFSPLMLATFATLFGGLGFISLGILGLIPIVPSSVAGIVSVLVSASLAIVLSSYFSYFLVKLFVKTETSSCISTAKLIGREAEVTLNLEPGKLGEVTYFHGGSRQVNMAKLVEGAASAKRGQIVEIVSINENVMWVRPAEEVKEVV
jgi:membrane protein implicated in regulation of membrane protease activity